MWTIQSDISFLLYVPSPNPNGLLFSHRMPCMYYILSLIIFAFTFGSLNPRSEHWEQAEWAYFIHQNRIFLLDNMYTKMYVSTGCLHNVFIVVIR
jgi:hypothetical protein